jgi:cytochrome c biogenesis protein CcdA/thiol-disulfide isomerase/thioredoxin
MLLFILTFIAGFLTALAPCVLPLLPVIIGGSFTGVKDKRRPYIITGSLVLSLILFTILLKASTVLIGIDPRVWTYVSGGLIILLGIVMLYPNLWDEVIGRLGIQSKAQELLGSAGKHSGSTTSAILTGLALGPVFSSCSPTYAWVLATVLPKSSASGVFYLAIYSIGLALSLLLISLLGRKLLDKIKWASNPRGIFQKAIAILFIIVGLGILSGFDKRVQTWLVDKDYLHLIQLEQKLVPKDTNASAKTSSGSETATQAALNNPKLFNINPYKAPEITGINTWINSDPLTIKSLRGKVVLVDFWTYSCINCVRTLPYVEKWYETYKDKGFVVIGVHAPEFSFEKVPENVQKAVKERNVTYPVAMDNDLATWQAFNNQYWPASYFIDRDGNVRREHFGEGEYMDNEATIRTLLGEDASSIDSTVKSEVVVPITRTQTPETYLGAAREERFVKDGGNLSNNQWNVSGSWSQDKENLISVGNDAVLRIRVSAKKVFLVMSPAQSGSFASIEVSLNGVKKPEVMVGKPDIYTIINESNYQEGALLELKVPSGMKLNAFTFES